MQHPLWLLTVGHSDQAREETGRPSLPVEGSPGTTGGNRSLFGCDPASDDGSATIWSGRICPETTEDHLSGSREPGSFREFRGLTNRWQYGRVLEFGDAPGSGGVTDVIIRLYR